MEGKAWKSEHNTTDHITTTVRKKAGGLLASPAYLEERPGHDMVLPTFIHCRSFCTIT